MVQLRASIDGNLRRERNTCACGSSHDRNIRKTSTSWDSPGEFPHLPVAGSPPRFDSSCASRESFAGTRGTGTIRAHWHLRAAYLVLVDARTCCRALLYVRVWMHHVVLGGESGWPQSPTGRCWTRRAGCGLTGVDGLVLPLAAPVTRFRTPSSQRAGSQTLRPPNHSPWPGPSCVVGAVLPSVRHACGLGAETRQTPRQAPVRWTPLASPIVARC